MRSFHWFHLYFIPKVRKYLDSKGLPSKDSYHTGQCPQPHWTLWVQHWCFLLASQHNIPNSTFRSGVMRTFKAHYSILWEGLSILWNKTLIGRTTWKSGRIIPLKMSSWCYKKVWADRQPETINSCWRKLCLNVVHDFTGLLQSRSRKLWRACECGQKKVERKWRVSRYGS